MALRWISPKQARVINQLADRVGELSHDRQALNDGSHLPAGVYWLVDARPVGGWKGNNWAILWSDFARSHAEWFASKADAEAHWLGIQREAAKQGIETSSGA